MKRLIDRIAAEDAKTQCTKDPQCHRKNLHDGDCKTLGVVLLEKAEQWLRGLAS